MQLYEDEELTMSIQDWVRATLDTTLHDGADVPSEVLDEWAERMARESKSALYMVMNDNVTAEVVGLTEGDRVKMESRQHDQDWLFRVAYISDDGTEFYPVVLEGERRDWRTSINVGTAATSDRFTINPDEEA